MFLSLLAAASVVIIWVLRIIFPAKMNWRYSLLPVLIVAMALGLDYFVKTDAEKIHHAISASIKSFKQKDIEPIAAVISDDYSDKANGSKQLMVAYCQALFEIAPIKKVMLLNKEFVIDGGEGTYVATAIVKFDEEGEIGKVKPIMSVKFRLYFKRLADKSWVFYSSDIIEIDKKPINWAAIKSL